MENIQFMAFDDDDEYETDPNDDWD